MAFDVTVAEWVYQMVERRVASMGMLMAAQ